MDENAKEAIIDDINPQRGVNSEIDRVLSKNESLSSSATWNGATDKQKRAIRSRMSSTRSYDSLKFERGGKTYVRVDKNNYRRVTSKEDVYVANNGNVYLRDEKGRFKEVIK